MWDILKQFDRTKSDHDGNLFRPGRSRCGITLIELTAACFLMAAIGGSLLPLLSRLDAARENQRRRQVALVELENLLERASLIPAAEVTPARLSALADKLQIGELLPGAKVQIETREQEGKPAAVQVRYRITHTTAKEGTRELASLEQWFFSGEKP
ncbi:MAG: hypothetical protein U0903_09390 [Planctomycetales bacterium]